MTIFKHALGKPVPCDLKTCSVINHKAQTCTNQGCHLHVSKGAK